MKIISDNPNNLLEKLELAKKQLKNAKNREEQLALTTYIHLLKVAIYDSFPGTIPKPKYYNNKKNRVYNKKFTNHEEKMVENFAHYKDFHEEFFEPIRKVTVHELRKYVDGNYSGITDLSEKEFYEIFFDFMAKLGLDKYFDKFIRGRRLYSIEKILVEEDDFSKTPEGYIVHNPINKDTDIFMRKLRYNIWSMHYLAHEFGHVYDLNHFDEDITSFNIYNYESFNKEVIPMTFERLFLDHLIENNILVEEAKDQFFDMNYIYYEFILSAYIISLIPHKYFDKELHLSFSSNKLFEMVGNHFSRNDLVKKFINKLDTLDTQDTYSYAYGDVFSLFFKERIKEDNYSLDSLKEFFELRSKQFDPKILEKLDINRKEYVKLYKKDIELLKKQSN